MRYAVVVSKAEPAGYCVHAPDVKLCFATGSTPEEALARFKNALGHHLRALVESGVEPPVATTLVSTVEIEDVA